MADDTNRLDALKDKGDYNGLLTLAKEYYDGNGWMNSTPMPLHCRTVAMTC